MKTEEVNLEKKLKIIFIDPIFKEDLMEGYKKYKDNDKIHKKNAAIKR